MKIIIAGATPVGLEIAQQLITEKKDVVIIEQDTRIARRISNYLDCMIINGQINDLNILKEAGSNKADFFIAVTDLDEMNIIACSIVGEQFKVPNIVAMVKKIEYAHVDTNQGKFLGINYIANPEIEVANDIIRSINYGALGEVLSFEKTNFLIRNSSVDYKSPIVNTSIKTLKKSTGIDFLVAFILREKDYIIPSGNTEIRENDNLYFLSTEENLEILFNRLGKSKLKLNKIAIGGGGKIGEYLTDYLLHKHNFNSTHSGRKLFNIFKKRLYRIILIERDLDVCKQLSERFPEALVLNEDIADEGIYETNQLYTYDLCITVTGNQELNLISAIYGKTIGIKRAIAVVEKKNYVSMGTRLGIDVAICKNTSTANRILKLTRKSNIRNIYSFAEGKIEVMELMVDQSPVSGRKLHEIKLPSETLIVSITEKDKNILPDGNSVIKNSDSIVVISRKESVPEVINIFTGKQ